MECQPLKKFIDRVFALLGLANLRIFAQMRHTDAIK